MKQFYVQSRARVLTSLEVVATVLANHSPDDAATFRERGVLVADDWLNSRSANTIRAYVYDLGRWADDLTCSPPSRSPIDAGELRAFLDREFGRNIFPRSVSRRASSLRVVLRDLGLLTDDRRFALLQVHRAIHHQRLPARQVDTLPSDLIERIARAIDPDDVRRARDLALAAVLLHTMVRPAELLGMCVEGTWLVPPVEVSELRRNRDGSGCLPLRVLDGRRVLLMEPAHVPRAVMQRIDTWLSMAGITCGPLFRSIRQNTQPSPSSRPLQPAEVRRILLRLGKYARLRHPLNITNLRAHTINRMLDAGLHLDDVRRAARVSSMSTITRLHAHRREEGSRNDVLRRFQAAKFTGAAERHGATPQQLELL